MTAFSYLAPYFSANVATAVFAVARSGAAQIWRRSALAAGCTDLGSLSSTLAVLWTGQRWCRGRRRHLLKRLPEAKRAVAGGQFRRDRQATSLQIDQQFTPALGAFPDADLEPEQLLLTLRRGSDQHQHAFGLRFH